MICSLAKNTLDLPDSMFAESRSLDNELRTNEVTIPTIYWFSALSRIYPTSHQKAAFFVALLSSPESYRA